MIDTKVEVNGKEVGKYDLIKEPDVKTVNGEGPDNTGNVVVESDGPTINGGYDIKELVTLTDETATSGQLLTNCVAVNKFFMKHSGDTVVVTFDGTLYQCTINGDPGFQYVGDPNFVEYPFRIYAVVVIEEYPYNMAYLYTATAGESHTVKIEGYDTTPVVFDKKYIPDLKTLTGSEQYMNGRILVVNESGVPVWKSLDSIINSANGVSF